MLAPSGASPAGRVLHLLSAVQLSTDRSHEQQPARDIASSGRQTAWTAVLDFATAPHAARWRMLVLVSLLAFLPGFFQIPPVDRDEAHFAQATKQMIETGDYIDIHFQDEARYKAGRHLLAAGGGREDGRGARPAERAHHDLALSHSVADRGDRRGAGDLLGALAFVSRAAPCWPR